MTASLTAFLCAASSPIPRSTELRRLEARLTAGEVRLLKSPPTVVDAYVDDDAAPRLPVPLLLPLLLPPG